MAQRAPTIATLFQNALSAMRSGNANDTREICQRILQENPTHADALHLLGVAERELGNAEASIQFIQSSLRLRPGIPAAYHNLGAAHQNLSDYEQAASCYQQAIDLNPKHIHARYSLGCMLGKLGKHAEAETHFRHAIRLNPAFAEAHHDLASYLAILDKKDEALHHARAASDIKPDAPLYLLLLAKLLVDKGDAAEASALYNRCVSLRPDWPMAWFARLHALPRIYRSSAQIDEYRQLWRKHLQQWVHALDKGFSTPSSELLETLTSGTNFFLHYQGQNDQELQQAYADSLTRIAHTLFPDYAKPRRSPHNAGEACNKRIRIGFVSAFFRRHSVFKSHGRFVSELDPEQFETFAYYLGKKTDQATQEIRARSDHFYQLGDDIPQIVQQIDQDQLDILFYTDIGMEPRIQALAPLRLAPVQMTSWGHPVTSGLASIDYYLSSELMEPDDAQAQYSETLIRLPGLGVNYPRPEPSSLTPTDIEDPGYRSGPIFLCSQSLFKLLPDNDAVFPQIAQRVGACRFWFVGAAGEHFIAPFKLRLAACFQQHGLAFDDYVHIFPRLSQDAFLALNQAADVGLDSFHWSGFNSSMEAFAQQLPVVTIPGNSMRSRHTAACLQRMQLGELIAQDIEQFIGIATELGLNSALRENIRKKIQRHSHQLFDDPEPIRAFEKLAIEAVRNHHSAES